MSLDAKICIDNVNQNFEIIVLQRVEISARLQLLYIYPIEPICISLQDLLQLLYLSLLVV